MALELLTGEGFLGPSNRKGELERLWWSKIHPYRKEGTDKGKGRERGRWYKGRWYKRFAGEAEPADANAAAIAGKIREHLHEREYRIHPGRPDKSRGRITARAASIVQSAPPHLPDEGRCWPPQDEKDYEKAGNVAADIRARAEKLEKEARGRNRFSVRDAAPVLYEQYGRLFRDGNGKALRVPEARKEYPGMSEKQVSAYGYVPPPPPGRIRWVLRLLGWNALLLFAGVVLIAMAGEAYLRLTRPFMGLNAYWEFVPNVGLLRTPNTEIRSTNRLDFWNVSRTNSLGFLDREPPSPEHAAATCHISMIGDSFVEAAQVPIHDKFHVRLEELAADELPHMDITTSAFGIGGTGQVQQLPFYDEYARLLHPKLLVLVFVDNDLLDNAPVPRALALRGNFRKNFLEPMVSRRSDGKLELAWSRPRNYTSGAARAMKESVGHSLFARWLRDKKIAFFPSDHDRQGFQWDGVQFTQFAMEQFKQRADRDHVNLVILTTYTWKLPGTAHIERLSQMAAALDIPVIDQGDYILRQGYKLGDAHWPHDSHWNPAGHRWAAEALLEYIKEHPAICDGPT